jgi:hypothetical protein
MRNELPMVPVVVYDAGGAVVVIGAPCTSPLM